MHVSSCILNILSHTISNDGVVILEGYLHISCHYAFPGCSDYWLIVCCLLFIS